MSSVFPYLAGVRWSDNICTVGWSSVWARNWDRDSLEKAMRYCPKGHFTQTTYTSSDERKGWNDAHKEECKRYCAPAYVLYKGAYFSFPLDRGALQLMQALGLVDECMVMAASGGRFPFPDEGFRTGGLPLCMEDTPKH